MTATSPSAPHPIPRPRARRWTPQTRRNTITGLLFISPWLVGFLGFYLYPALASLYYSFTDFRILQPPEWIGLQNYQRMVNDPLFWKALGNTIWLVLVMVPISVGVALGVSPLLNVRGIFGMSIFRTIFYLPVVVPAVASAVLRIWLLNPKYGLVNAALGVVGIDGTAMVLRRRVGEARARVDGGLGRRGRDRSSTSAPCRACRATCTTRPRSTVRGSAGSYATSRSR